MSYNSNRGPMARGAPRGGEAMGRGGGIDRGRGNSWGANSKENTDLDFCDGGGINSGVVVPMARKQLIDQDGTVMERSGSQPSTYPTGFVFDKVNFLENISNETIDNSSEHSTKKIHDQKR